MTKIDIISGFLGAGKTTLINRLIHEAYSGEKIVLIENEFGEIGIDGAFLQETGVEIAEMNSGCICCSLVGDFSKALKQVVCDYAPDRILIEPSGVGKLSDVTKAVIDAQLDDAMINSAVVVVDVNKCKMYMKNFGEFFNDQIDHAGCIYFSHTDKTTEAKLTEALALVKARNSAAAIITTPADKLDINDLMNAFAQKTALNEQLKLLSEEEICPECGHHHHHHDHHDHHEHHEHHHHDHEHDEHCRCEHHHRDHEHEHHHEHHHDRHHEHDHHGEHEHCCDHHHDRDCEHGDHHHHHHHHADDVFSTWGKETVKKYSKEQISNALSELENTEKYGFILRAKGVVECECGKWIYFDYVPGEPDIRIGSASTIGKICVIGADIKEDLIAGLFSF